MCSNQILHTLDMNIVGAARLCCDNPVTCSVCLAHSMPALEALWTLGCGVRVHRLCARGNFRQACCA